MSAAWAVVEYPGIEGLQRLEADWRRLVAEMPDHAFHHAYETHLAYFRQMPDGASRATCLALSDGERIRAICPLEAQTLRILGRRTPIWGLPTGLGNVPRDFVGSPDPEVMDQLLPRLVAHLRTAAADRRWLVLESVLPDSTAWRSLGALNVVDYATDLVGAMDVIDCDRSFEELVARCSRRVRRNLRNGRSQLAELPGVRWAAASGEGDLLRLFEDFLEVEASGWKGESGTRTAIKYRPRPLALYRDLLAGRPGAGRFEVNALYAEGRCVGAQLCASFGREYAVFRIAYDERYDRLAPGVLLLGATLERCCRDPGLTRVNLLSQQDWHADWRPVLVPRHGVYIPLHPRWGRSLVRLLRWRWRSAAVVKRPLLALARLAGRRPADA